MWQGQGMSTQGLLHAGAVFVEPEVVETLDSGKHRLDPFSNLVLR